MMMITKIPVLMCVSLLLFIVPRVFAQERSLTVSGTVKEAATGEELIGAAIRVKGVTTGTVSDAYGRYSLSLPPGNYTLVVSYIGYIAQEHRIALDTTHQSVPFTLEQDNRQLSEVVVSAEGHNAHISRLDMGTERLTVKAIKAMPALMGEVDVIKAIQMLPGVQSTAEGTSGFSVRGGSHDQNLILLDEATVYNASHLMGFFSVFNNDAIKDVVLYKGDIPANFGGRLSSLLDIRSKEGNSQRYAVTGGIGIISSRLTVEGPIMNDKLSFLASARRTYADIFLKLLPDDNDASGSSLYFYDFNVKLNYRISERDRISLAGYLGKDHFGTSFAGMSFGNKTLSARWNHMFSPKLFANFSLIASSYDYYMLIDMNDQLDQDWRSKMQDVGFKADFSYYPNPRHHLRFGYNGIHHTFLPGEGGGLGDNPVVQRFGVPRQYGAEQAFYLTDEASAGERVKLKYGLRFSLYHNIANGEEITYLDHYEAVRTEKPTKGSIYNTYHQFEPRLGIAYILSDEQSLKASYSRTAQYIQMASNSAAGSPLDVWFQSSHNVKPQLSDQFSVGYFRSFSGNVYEASAELYYKKLSRLIDFKDHAELMGNEALEQELRFGSGYSYGLELLFRKNSGKLNGWVSYTYSRSRHQVDEINGGASYNSPYDKPHALSLIANYEISDNWSLSANWVYATGKPVTYPTGRFLIEGNYVPIYSGRNEYRLPDYHRLDLSATCRLSKPGSKLKHDLNISLYNAYGRRNPWFIRFAQEEESPDVTYAEMVYLFSVIPSITWNFTF